ncbi:MAG: hypothetical protein SFV24_19255 [Gemmatimonadales bacterium]|nr:hypothetical protein [Gemmatimonadales bacterium]
MKNVSTKILNGKLIIEVDLEKSFGPSKSGKTQIIATTEGNAKLDTPAGPVFLGLNAYRKEGA